MQLTPNTAKRFNPQKLFGCIGSQVRGLFPLLSWIKVKKRKRKRCKPKKNSGLDHSMQFLASKLCGHKSIYKMVEKKTPKTLKRKGIRFLCKSTHYDNIGNIDVDSVWSANARLLQEKHALTEQLITMLDGTPDILKGKKYDAARKGYIGRKNDKPVTGYCHQIFSIAIVGLKKFLYALRTPGEYNVFSNPKEHDDMNLSGLNFDESIAVHIVKKAHELLPGKRFLWLFDRGFDKHEFWHWLKDKFNDDFVTSLDKGAECVKQEQRLIDSGAVVLKKSKGFDYHETLVHVEKMALRAVYIKPHNNKPVYWLLTTKNDLNGVEIKKLYNKRSGEEPLYDYLKNDFNAKKPCKKSFAGAQAYTALLCLTQNIVSDLSQKIFSAYHRLSTLTAFFLELLALDLLFQTTPKNHSHTPPPQPSQPSACQKKAKREDALLQHMLNNRANHYQTQKKYTS